MVQDLIVGSLAANNLSMLTLWWTLLEYMMWTEDLYRYPNIQSTLQGRGSPTFAWEEYVHAYKNANDGKNENDLLKIWLSISVQK